MDNTDSYIGLSIEDAIDRYYVHEELFQNEFRLPLERILSRAIRRRIRELDGRSEEYMKQYHNDRWSIRLPFALMFPDKDNIDKYWLFLDTGVGTGGIYASRLNEEEEVEETVIDYDVDTLIRLYKNLKRMGFWEPEWAASFNYTA